MVIAFKSVPKKPVMEKQELVGNCKEIRINNNKTYLRIIGNCNKIRINTNTGHIDVIGNSSKVKILNNSGNINYTGNCGKIYLGKESTVQNVNYIGNSGILKIVSSTELSGSFKKTTEKCKSNSWNKSPNQPTPTEAEDADIHSYKKTQNVPKSEKKIYLNGESKRSSADIKIEKDANFCLCIKNNVSMPNLDSIQCILPQISNSIRIASSTGNIVVNNTFHV